MVISFSEGHNNFLWHSKERYMGGNNMNFCQKCNTHVDAGLKFCTGCGSPVSGGAPASSISSMPPTPPPPPPAYTPPPPPPPSYTPPPPAGGYGGGAYGGGYGAPGPAAGLLSNPKAIAAVGSLILCVVMMLGWVSWTTEFLGHGADIDPLTRQDNFSIATELRFIRDLQEDSIQQWGSPERIRDFRRDVAPIDSFATLSSVFRVVTLLTAVGFAVFVFFLFTGHRKTGFVGQLSALVATLSALIYAGNLLFNGDDIAEAAEGLMGGVMIDVTATIWAWLSLLLGIVLLVYITKNKSLLDR